jgi:hypothetical protein
MEFIEFEKKLKNEYPFGACSWVVNHVFDVNFDG